VQSSVYDNFWTIDSPQNCGVCIKMFGQRWLHIHHDEEWNIKSAFLASQFLTFRRILHDSCLFKSCVTVNICIFLEQLAHVHAHMYVTGKELDFLQCESKKNPPIGDLHYTYLSTLDDNFLFNCPRFWRSYAILLPSSHNMLKMSTIGRSAHVQTFA